MPFDQMQVRDYAVVIHAGNDEWTWQVMDFNARSRPKGRLRIARAPGAAGCSRRARSGPSPGSVGASSGQPSGQKKGRLLQEKKTAEVA